MSQNLTDYAIVPSLASGMLQNFTDYALMLPFDSQHVAKLHRLPNNGCQVPRSGQAKDAWPVNIPARGTCHSVRKETSIVM